MRNPTVRITLLSMSLALLCACNGSSNSSMPGTPNPPNPPPAVDNSFTSYVKSLLATPSPDTAIPSDVNARELTFDENPAAFNDTLGN